MPLMRIRLRTGLYVGFLLIFFGWTLAVSGCRGEEAADADEGAGATADASGFGEPYEITTVDAPDEAGMLPHIANDTLVVNIAYTGGCGEHDFSLHHRVARDTSKLWIHHESAGEGDDDAECRRRLRDQLRLPVPDRAQEAPSVVLLNPQNHPPVILKWR